MIFDRLARFAERHPDQLAGLREILDQARLFHFPYSPHEVLPKTYDEETLSFHCEFFALPFRTVAIEDNASCIVLWDDKPDAQGWNERRFFVECAPLDDQHAKAWSNTREDLDARAQMPDYVRKAMQNAMQIAFGVVYNINPRPKEGVDPTQPAPISQWRYAVEGDVFAMLIFDGEEAVRGEELFEQHRAAITPGIVRNAITAIEEMMQLNQPHHFIVEATPIKERRNKAGKILRSPDRPLYTLLTPTEIRRLLQLPEHTGVKRGSHERRRHVRRYPDDPVRWPHAHGKTVVIPATWVGPSEATVKKRHYKVRLDL